MVHSNISGEVAYGAGLPYQRRAFGGEAAEVHVLLQNVLASTHVGTAHPHAHRRTALQMSPVSQRLQAEPASDCSHGQFPLREFSL